MSWQVELTDSAIRDLPQMNKNVAGRIIPALERLAETGQGDVVRLKVHDPEWRRRVGDWLVRFVFDYEEHTITILRVLPRGSAYRE